jgi:hypothetical protein
VSTGQLPASRVADADQQVFIDPAVDAVARDLRTYLTTARRVDVA